MAGELAHLELGVAYAETHSKREAIVPAEDLRALLQLCREQHELLQCATSFDAVEGGWDVHARVMEQYKEMGGE